MAATLEQLEKRVSALERAQNETTVSLKWIVGTLGQMQAQQDAHTQQIARIAVDVGHIKIDLTELRDDLPSIVGTAVREAIGSGT